MNKRKHAQQKISAKTGAALAQSIAAALQPMNERDFAKHQLQAQLLTNMAFMMADCFDSIIRDMMCLMHKMIYDRAGSPIDMYRIYQFIKSMPSQTKWQIEDYAEHFAFGHIPAGYREAVDQEFKKYNNNMETKNDKKTAVLLMSTEFSKWHKQAGKPTMFVDKLANGDKLHTIRTNYDYWCKKAEQINAGAMELSLRIWSGKPYRSSQHEVGRLQHLEVQKFEATYSYEDAVPRVWIDGKEVSAEEVALRDGLSLDDWVQWTFRGVNRIENWALLQLTNFKY